MQKSKTKTIGLIALCVVAIFVSLFSVYAQKSNINNVFDEMHYAWKEYGQPDIASKTSVEKFQNTDGHVLTSVENSVYHDGIFDIALVSNIANSIVGLTIRKKENFMTIHAAITIDEGERMVYWYTYRGDTNTLTLEPLAVHSDSMQMDKYELVQDTTVVQSFMELHNLTPEQVQAYSDQFLYDVVIASWVGGNGDLSDYSVDNPGSFKIENNLL